MLGTSLTVGANLDLGHRVGPAVVPEKLEPPQTSAGLFQVGSLLKQSGLERVSLRSLGGSWQEEP